MIEAKNYLIGQDVDASDLGQLVEKRTLCAFFKRLLCDAAELIRDKDFFCQIAKTDLAAKMLKGLGEDDLAVITECYVDRQKPIPKIIETELQRRKTNSATPSTPVASSAVATPTVSTATATATTISQAAASSKK